MCLVGDGEKLLGEISVGVILGARAPLLRHHLPLRVDLARLEQQVAHAVGLEAEDEAHPVGGDVDVVGRDVLGGEGVVLPAVLLDRLRELSLAMGRRALEHHVLEERAARWHWESVARADLVPGLNGKDGTAVSSRIRTRRPLSAWSRSPPPGRLSQTFPAASRQGTSEEGRPKGHEPSILRPLPPATLAPDTPEPEPEV
jgi:hypothetical protein